MSPDSTFMLHLPWCVSFHPFVGASWLQDGWFTSRHHTPILKGQRAFSWGCVMILYSKRRPPEKKKQNISLAKTRLYAYHYTTQVPWGRYYHDWFRPIIIYPLSWVGICLHERGISTRNLNRSVFHLQEEGGRMAVECIIDKIPCLIQISRTV